MAALLKAVYANERSAKSGESQNSWAEFREGHGKPLLSAFHLFKIYEDSQNWLAPVFHLFGKFSGESINA